MTSGRVEIPGSAPLHRAGERVVGRPEGMTLTATVVLRRGTGPIGADASDLAAVQAFAQQSGLRVIEADAAKRSVKLQGKPSDFDRAFGVQLHSIDQGGATPYLTYDGSLSVPESLQGMVMAVLGLDNRPVARMR